MIDIHCHILPLLDDGPEELSEAVAMARIAAADGITHIVATPHVSGDLTAIEKDALAVCLHSEVDRLRDRLIQEKVPVGIVPGAEIAHANVNTQSLAGFSINKTRYFLLEFPHTHLPPEAKDLVFQLANGGYYPIIAHPERNLSIIENPKKLLILREMGALVQVTAASLTDTRDQDVKHCAFYMLKKGMVDFVATDAHSSQSRPPVLSAAYEVVARLLNAERAEALMRGNATAMLRGKALETRVQKQERSGFKETAQRSVIRLFRNKIPIIEEVNTVRLTA